MTKEERQIKGRRASNWLKIIISILIVVAALIFFPTDVDKEPGQVTIDTSDWKTFESEQYDFQIKYPAMDWNNVAVPNDEIAPKFNFYIKPAGVPVNTPFDHFANITNVSVYPEGIPTEGLFGTTENLPTDWSDKFTQESRLYVLQDGTPYAVYLKFRNVPESWNDSGYAWIRLRVDNMEEVCFEDGKEVGPADRCDPLGNPDITIKRKGDVDSSVWPKLKAAAESIEFTNN